VDGGTGEDAVTIRIRENGPALAAGLLLAAGVKLAYSRLGPDDLRWMTGPTQALVGLVSGLDFTYESGYGYVNLAHRLVIAKSCAGVNYLLAVFGLLTFTLVPAVASRRLKLCLVGVLAGCAFGVTVLVNALRISLALALHESGVAWGWLSAGRVHRIAGIAVYFASLVGAHLAARYALRHALTEHRTARPLLMAPLFWYGVVALAIPLLNGAFAARPLVFAEHCGWVVLVTLLLAGVFGAGAGRTLARPRQERVGERRGP
jgi:exosortase K